MERISAVMLTKNSEKYLDEILTHLLPLDEVLLYDNGSTDGTFAIAEKYPNVTLIKAEFEGFGQMRNKGALLARNDWILRIDSDEVPTDELMEYLKNLKPDPHSIYCFKFINYFHGKELKWCSEHIKRERLYHRKMTKIQDKLVHEGLVCEGLNMIDTPYGFKHYSYESYGDFLSKLQMYTDLFAKHNVGKLQTSPWIAVKKGFYAFFRYYFFRLGFLDGYEGFAVCIYAFNSEFYRHLKLYEANMGLIKDQKNTAKEK
jgi:glycosyltransferase involved in cell wall biosynthesis